MLTLEQIPMRQDNYSYALIKDDEVIMIDPSESHESLEYFSKNPHLKLRAILNTHCHIDHVGGNHVLFETFHCKVYGPTLEQERIPKITNTVRDQDEFEILGVKFKAFDVRAHTTGHLAFLVDEPVDIVIKHGHHREPYEAKNLSGHKVMFVGDSLFTGGCGRLFEGTKDNLLKCLSFYHQQEKDILVACAHEYTKANLRFAVEMFPDNGEISKRLQDVDDLLCNEGSSIPCFFELEHMTNPFILALRDPERGLLAKRFGIDPEDLCSIVAALRKAKDEF